MLNFRRHLEYGMSKTVFHAFYVKKLEMHRRSGACRQVGKLRATM